MRTKATPAPALVLQGDEIAAGFTTSGRPHAAADTAAAMPINSANDSAIPALHSRPAAIKKWFQQKGRHIAVRIFAIILAAGLWQAASANEWNFLLNFENIPTPVTVGNEFVEQLQNPTFYTHLGVSIKRILIAYVLAALLGIFLGVLMGRYAVVEDIFIPYIEILRPIPAVAWIPLSILMLPTEESSIIFITFLGALFPIVLNTLHGVEHPVHAGAGSAFVRRQRSRHPLARHHSGRHAQHRRGARHRDGRGLVFTAGGGNHQRSVRHRLLHLDVVSDGGIPAHHHRHADDRRARHHLHRTGKTRREAAAALAE
jgi:hypothetical protein